MICVRQWSLCFETSANVSYQLNHHWILTVFMRFSCYIFQVRFMSTLFRNSFVRFKIFCLFFRVENPLLSACMSVFYLPQWQWLVFFVMIYIWIFIVPLTCSVWFSFWKNTFSRWKCTIGNSKTNKRVKISIPFQIRLKKNFLHLLIFVSQTRILLTLPGKPICIKSLYEQKLYE